LEDKPPVIWTKDRQMLPQSTWPFSPIYYVVHAYPAHISARLCDASMTSVVGSIVCSLRAATVAKMMGVAFTIDAPTN